MQYDVQSRIRGARTDRATDGGDTLEHSDLDSQRDTACAMLQMRAETLSRINEALGRLDAGQYGVCVECESAITERRLRALPFRCGAGRAPRGASSRSRTCSQSRNPTAASRHLRTWSVRDSGVEAPPRA
jgi:hypothetical protein